MSKNHLTLDSNKLILSTTVQRNLNLIIIISLAKHLQHPKTVAPEWFSNCEASTAHGTIKTLGGWSFRPIKYQIKADVNE